MLDDCAGNMNQSELGKGGQKDLPERFITNLSQSDKNTLDFIGLKA